MGQELWSAARIAEEFGWSGAAVARKWIHRHGLEHEATAGPRDTRLYDPEKVRAAHASGPGRGRRTDLLRLGVAKSAATPVTVRLWWRCRLCGWRIDTFGTSHGNAGDQRALGDEVLGHLADRHPAHYAALWDGSGFINLLDVAALFEPAGSVRPRKRHVLVSR